MAWGLESAAALITYIDGVVCVSDVDDNCGVGDASDDRWSPVQTGMMTLGRSPCLLISWSLLFTSSYRWPMIVGISPGVPTRLADAATLRAAISWRCWCLPARQPRRHSPSDTCRRACWLSCTALEAKDNSRSRVYTVAVEVVIKQR